MRLWYWFLLILLLIGLILVFIGEYLIFNAQYGLGWEFSMYGAIVLAFVLAVGLLYFERWRRKWWRS